MKIKSNSSLQIANKMSKKCWLTQSSFSPFSVGLFGLCFGYVHSDQSIRDEVRIRLTASKKNKNRKSTEAK